MELQKLDFSLIPSVSIYRNVLTAKGNGIDCREVWSEKSDRLEELLSTRGKTVLIINDVTRPTPTGEILRPVAEILESRMEIIVATGTHRPVNEIEKNNLLEGLFPGDRWSSHDCDANDLVSFGETSRGTPVLLNRSVAQADTIIAVNSVEPHYFAGFTGGRKSILPGVSGRKAIVLNHALACFTSADALILDGNPVHEDMQEALEMVESRIPILQANAVLSENRIVFLTISEPVESFRVAVSESLRYNTVDIPCRFRKVVALVEPPMDISLYQSMKAVFHCERAVEDGGILLLVSRCREGLGAEHLEHALKSSFDDTWKAPSRSYYQLGDHETVKLKRIRKRIDIALMSDLPSNTVKELGFDPVNDVRKWIEYIDNGSTAVFPGATVTVPIVRQAKNL